jgi:2-oxoglutarate ferredoxin oxidoreductase subunit delta
MPGGKSFEIKIIAGRCKECGLCINICPVKILEAGDRINEKGFYVTTVSEPDKCIGCMLCEQICPDYAIFVSPLEGGKSIGKVIWDRVEVYEG